MVKSESDYSLATVATTNKHRPQDINNLHKQLGHMSEALIQKGPNFMAGSSKLILKFVRAVPSPNCTRKTPTRRKRHRAMPVEQLFINISHVKSQSFGGWQYWLLAINDTMDFSFSLFLKTKDQMLQAIILLIKELRNSENIVMKKIRCDNLGENVAIQATAKNKFWASIFSLWPAKLHSRMAAFNASLPLCLERTSQCSTWPDSLTSMKTFSRGCGPGVQIWQPRWKIWLPRLARIHPSAASTSETQCSSTPSTFLERLPLCTMCTSCAASWPTEKSTACLSVMQAIMPVTHSR